MRRLLFIAFGWFIAAQLLGQTMPAGFVHTEVVAGLQGPTAMVFTPDGSVMITEQGGRLKMLKANSSEVVVLLRLVVDSVGERGLVGLALSPEYPAEPHIFLYYTVPPVPGVTTKSHNRISRFTIDNDVVLPGSEFVLLDLDNLGDNKSHNGGALNFSKDGKLYIAVGDAGNSVNAQNLDRYFGKILRINSDGSVPDDNPFAPSALIRKYFWSYGLRNPFTFARNPVTDRFFVNDVGLKDYEEINDIGIGGKNYGWPDAEGFSDNPNFENPVYAYPHGIGEGVGCAITGGTFFVPDQTNFPQAYYDKYFFIDFCQRWINYIDYNVSPAVRHPFANLISSQAIGLTAGPDGTLYYLSRSANALYKIAYTLGTAPYVTSQPSGISLLEGNALALVVKAAGSEPLNYQWRRNGVDIEGETSPQLLIPAVTPEDSATFSVHISNAVGAVESSGAIVYVTRVYTPPNAIISSPSTNQLFRIGEPVSFSGSATDLQEGELLPAACHWKIEYHTGNTSTLLATFDDTLQGSFTPGSEAAAASGWFEIILEATDTTQLTGTDTLRIYPLLSTITLQTDPPGLAIQVDGTNYSGPFQSVAGSTHMLGANSPQQLGTNQFQFVGWEPEIDGGLLVTPEQAIGVKGIFDVVLGLNESRPAWRVYPNPAADEAWLNVPAGFGPVRSVDVYSSTGVQLESDRCVSLQSENRIQLLTSGWAAGVYLLRIKGTDSVSEAIRLVIY